MAKKRKGPRSPLIRVSDEELEALEIQEAYGDIEIAKRIKRNKKRKPPKRRRLPPKDMIKWPDEGDPGHDVVDNTPEENRTAISEIYNQNELDEYRPSNKIRGAKPKPKPKTPKLKIPKVPSQEGHDTTIIEGGGYRGPANPSGRRVTKRSAASNKKYTNPSRKPRKN
jgi:hypothetical protein|tara:strand:+ start:89 stop:592 length:504 start_codon:yes stop_codon:yes gene_type:complete